MDERGTFHLEKAAPIDIYGTYFGWENLWVHLDILFARRKKEKK